MRGHLHHRFRHAGLVCLVALSLSATDAAAATWSGPTIVTTAAQQGYEVDVDSAFSGTTVAAAWVSGSGATSVPWLRVSSDGGATFGAPVQLAPFPAESATPTHGSDVHVAVCDGAVWAAVRGWIDDPADAQLIVTEVGTGGVLSWTVDDPGVERLDIACGGGRVWVVTMEPHPGKPHVLLRHARIRDLHAGGRFGAPIDLGRSGADDVSVAATSTVAAATWDSGTAIMLARFLVGPAPGRVVTRLAVRTLPWARDRLPWPRVGPVVAADGRSMAISYMRDDIVRLRVSRDRGATFGAATSMGVVPGPTNWTFVTSVAIHGRRIVAIVSEALGGALRTHRCVSGSAGRTWTATRLGISDDRRAGFLWWGTVVQLGETWLAGGTLSAHRTV